MTDIVGTLVEAVNVATLALVAFGGFYAARTLRLLKNNAELSNQRVFWVPILISEGLFAITAVPAFLISVVRLQGYDLDLVFSLFRGSALFFLSFAVFRYWRMTEKFAIAKKRALNTQK